VLNPVRNPALARSLEARRGEAHLKQQRLIKGEPFPGSFCRRTEGMNVAKRLC
jgi:hypothetical protein